MKYRRAISASVIYLTLLPVIYFLHVKLGKVDVVLYSSIFDAVAATGLVSALLFSCGYFRVFTSFEKVLLTVIYLLAGYAAAISIPTVIDRSLSFYILEKLQQRGGGIQLARFEEVFTKEYVKEHRLADVRLTEQLASGTITITGGCVRLTEHGERLASFSRWFRTTLLPKRRLLMGEYSADLTDPFRQSEEAVDYQCK